MKKAKEDASDAQHRVLGAELAYEITKTNRENNAAKAVNIVVRKYGKVVKEKNYSVEQLRDAVVDAWFRSQVLPVHGVLDAVLKKLASSPARKGS